jgi:hypothetical protein
MRKAGQTALPPPNLLPQAIDLKLPSREPGRDIPCRLIYPSSRKTEQERKSCKGTVCHLHGGGWTVSAKPAIKTWDTADTLLS